MFDNYRIYYILSNCFYRIYYILSNLIYHWYVKHLIILCAAKNNRDGANYNCKMPLILKQIPISEVLKLFFKVYLKIDEMQCTYSYTSLLF